MRRTKMEKGITLISLIITVLVLLILSAVAISRITDDRIIDKAQETTSEYDIVQEKEKLQQEALERSLIDSIKNITLEDHLAGIYGDANVQLNVDNSVTVTMPSGKKYIVREDGSVTLQDGTVEEPDPLLISVSLDKTTITKEIIHGESVTETITATLNNANGVLTWLSSDPDVVELATSEGNTRSIEIKKAGTAIITIKYAENTSVGASCTINITEKTNTVLAVKNTVLSKTKNTDIYDEYGNKIVVPPGFKIRVDDKTNNADTVPEGIVIEDCTETETKGSQFVWIPVGKIYTDVAQAPRLTKKITLGRYEFSTTGKPSIYTGSNTEDTEARHDSSYENKIARDIEAFITSANAKGGYYLGRYEARKNSNGYLTTVSTDIVWNSVNQPTASSTSKGMYLDGYSSGTFSSDLINSYAWDTAIVFLQTFDDREDEEKTTPYSRQKTLNTESVATTGTTKDVICNIYDMASNCYEWSTETCKNDISPCTFRGGSYNGINFYTSIRYNFSTAAAWADSSFRPLLYLGF